MHRSQVRFIPRQAEQAIVLAALRGGRHVQVGAPANRDGAHALHTILDSDLTGYRRDARGRMCHDASKARTHTINGESVSFYRVREGYHEFGDIETISVGRIRKGA